MTPHLFKFLWNFSSFEPIKRSTLYLPKTDGGIFLPSIGARTLSAFLWEFIFLLKQKPSISHFWMTYAFHNIGSKIKTFNPVLYFNLQPQSPKPNFYWSRILKAISKINISPDGFKTLTFKSLYLLILNPDSNPIPSLPDPLSTKPTPSSHIWPRLFLFKPHTSLFSNTEKEIAFRTAYKGYTWGCFFLKDLIPPYFQMNFYVNFALLPMMTPHLFFECPAAKYFISRLKPILSETLKKLFTLNRNCLYYSFTHLTGIPHTVITKMPSPIRLTLIQIRNHSLSFYTPISNCMLNENLYKIQTKLKTFKNFSSILKT